MSKNKITTSLILCLFATVNLLTAKELTGTLAQQAVKGAEKVITGTKSEIPEYIQFRKEANIDFAKFNAWAHKAFSLSSQYDFALINVSTDKIGMTHYRYKQTFLGMPVEGTMYIVHVKDAKIVSMNGTLFSKMNVATVPILNEKAALAKSLAYMNASVFRWELPQMEQLLKKQTNNPSATWFPKGELMLAPAKGNFSAESYRLSYRFDVYAEKPLSRKYVFVDATTGEVIYTVNRIHDTDVPATAVTAYSGTRTMTSDSVNATTYRLQETGRGLGIETYNLQQGTNYVNTDFTDTDNNWSNVNAQQDEYATDAHWGAEVTYDFYWLNFARSSVDGAGQKLLSYVHYDVNYTNAFWDGTEMTYGDGGGVYTPLTSLEITGHEISHGVTENSSGLIYADESGALNEAFSDCMGNAIREYGKGTGVINWLIGDEIGGTPFRSMSNPNQYQNPDCYNGQYWNAPNEVHNNSGVMNFWFYLLTEGGSGTNDIGNAYNVTGLGLTVAQAICYRMNAIYLTPSSDYADARAKAIQAAIDLYGPCTNEVIQTTNAWYAVGVGALFTPVVTSNFTAPVTSYCSIPATVTFINSSTNAGTFTWDFGDGTQSSAINPTHTYTAYGPYTVALVADGGSCGIDTLIKSLYISVDSLNPCLVILPTTGLGPLQTTCAGQLFDSGGPTADYTDNTDASVTISPVGASTVTLTFTSFDFELNFDYLYVYDGPSTLSPLIGQYTGNNLPNGGSITSTGGSITVRQTTDQSVIGSGFALTWQCFISTVPPTAAFSANSTVSCSGTISFNDLSTNGPTTWLWDFGDGSGTSTLQSPNHTYTVSGVYNVTLIVTNANGSDTLTLPNYITVNLPVAPTVTGATICPGTSAALNANGALVLTWFSVPTGGTQLDTGSVFNTPVIGATTTYYVESEIFPAMQYNTPHDNTFGTGTNYNNANYRDLVFDCFSPVKLVSVLVYATGAANRTITLIQNGTTLNTATINIPNGTSRITLNFDIPVGTNFELGMAGNADLFRNNAGAVFPYTINGLISITGTNAGAPGYYYFFYDWELQEPPCVSARVPVVATVTAGPTASFTSNTLGGTVNFTDASTGATSWLWDFGEPGSGVNNTSTLQNPSHTYAAVGNYVVTLTVNDGTCSHTITQTVQITTVGISEINNSTMVSVFPNPASEQVVIHFANAVTNSKWTLKLVDVLGKVVMEKQITANAKGDYLCDITTLAPALYTLILQNDEEKLMRKICKE